MRDAGVSRCRALVPRWRQHVRNRAGTPPPPVVNDDTGVRDVVIALLEPGEHHVIEVSSLAEALRMLCLGSPQYRDVAAGLGFLDLARLG